MLPGFYRDIDLTARKLIVFIQIMMIKPSQIKAKLIKSKIGEKQAKFFW